MGRSRVTGAITAAALAAALLVACQDGVDASIEEADAYLRAWSSADFEAMRGLVADPPGDFVAVHNAIWQDLHVRSAGFEAGSVERSGENATVPVVATIGVGGLGNWEYDTSLPMVRVDGEWRVDWTPAVIHPDLREGMRMDRLRQETPRAPILAAGGQPLAAGGAAIGGRAVTVASDTIGQVRPVEAADLPELGPEYDEGDTIGGTGLEAHYEETLSGHPAGQVRLLAPSGDPTAVLEQFEGTPPEPVQTTIDLAVQRAAEDAISGASLPTAMVVVDISTGEVRAVANAASPGFNRALSGVYPPGSTFKVVTASALLDSGMTPATVLPCPAEVQVGNSRPVSNHDFVDLGSVTLTQAFAQSCNTTFGEQGAGITTELAAMAEEYGFNVEYDPGIESVPASYPPPVGETGRVTAAIGQAEVTASPLHMASVAAAARGGTWRAPSIIAGHDTGAEPRDLPAAVDALPNMMRQVVFTGTGVEALVPGRDMGGKTGTAEFGNEDPPEAHGWFIGFVDDLAFAVLVEAGGAGGSVAAPIARQFIQNLPAA